MTGMLIISALVFLLYFQSGIYILLKNTGSRLNRLFFFISVYFGLWSVILALLSAASLEMQAELWDMTVKGGWTLVPAFFFRFFSILTRWKIDERKQLIIYYAYLFTGITIFLVYVTETLSWSLNNELFRDERLQIFQLADGILYAMLVVSVANFFHMFYRWQRSMRWRREKLQFGIIGYSLLVAIALVIIVDYLFPALVMVRNFRLPHVLFAPGYAGIAFGMIRYRFFIPDAAQSAEGVLNELKQILFFCNSKGEIQWTNQFSRDLVGFKGNDWQGFDVFKLFDDSDEVRNMISSTIEQGDEKPIHLDMQSLYLNEAIPVSISSAVLCDAYDDPHGIMIYGEDLRESIALEEEIFQRKKFEKHLRSVSGELEQSVNQRTRDLADSIKEIQVMMTERIETEESMRKEMEDMEIMLEEIHYRVKKNLRLMLSVTEAAGKCGATKCGQPLLHELTQRIKSILYIHEQLKLNKNEGVVDFRSFIIMLADDFQWSEDRVQGKLLEVKQTGNSQYLAIDQAVSVGLVVNEIFHLMNQLFESGNTQLKTPLVEVELKVGDDSLYHLGILSKRINKFSAFTEMMENQPGAQLIQMLVSDQLNGQLTVVAAGGVGVMISFARL